MLRKVIQKNLIKNFNCGINYNILKCFSTRPEPQMAETLTQVKFITITSFFHSLLSFTLSTLTFSLSNSYSID